jgi:hypothetical protein
MWQLRFPQYSNCPYRSTEGGWAVVNSLHKPAVWIWNLSPASGSDAFIRNVVCHPSGIGSAAIKLPCGGSIFKALLDAPPPRAIERHAKFRSQIVGAAV